MSDLFRPAMNLVMGPITGIRPNDDRWGGEMPQEYITAIYDDVVKSDIPMLLEQTMDFDDLEPILNNPKINEAFWAALGIAVIQTAVRTGQRLAVELDGCTIDTTTIFEDDEDV